MRTLIFAALMVVALGVAWGAYVLVGRSNLNLPTLAPSLSSEKTPDFTPYPSVSLSADDRKDFDSRIAKLAMNRLVEYSKIDKDKNVVFSPVCSMSTLGMLLAAADGDTEATILDELCMKGRSSAWVLNNFKQYFEELKKLDKDLPENAGDLAKMTAEDNREEPEPEELISHPADLLTGFRTANSVWSNSKYPTQSGFPASIRSYLAGDAFSTPFDRTTQATVDSWIERGSSGLIKDFGLGEIEDDPALVAVSAAVFSARWDNDSGTPFFRKTSTRDRQFTTPAGLQKTCPFMERTDPLWSYLETPEFQAVQINYELYLTSMLFVLPSKESGTDGFLTHLAKGAFQPGAWKFDYMPGTVRLPKFDFRCSYESVPTLRLMDRLAFDRAFAKPLSGLSVVSRQAAEISVDERGTRAIAIEYSTTGPLGRRRVQPIDLTFDRPFAFFIMYGDSEIPLFAGIVNDPCEHGDK